MIQPAIKKKKKETAPKIQYGDYLTIVAMLMPAC